MTPQDDRDDAEALLASLRDALREYDEHIGVVVKLVLLVEVVKADGDAWFHTICLPPDTPLWHTIGMLRAGSINVESRWTRPSPGSPEDDSSEDA